MGILELLTLVFVILKVAEVIDWSWWLIFSPLYVYVVIAVLWYGFVFTLALLGAVSNVKFKKKRK